MLSIPKSPRRFSMIANVFGMQNFSLLSSFAARPERTAGEPCIRHARALRHPKHSERFTITRCDPFVISTTFLSTSYLITSLIFQRSVSDRTMSCTSCVPSLENRTLTLLPSVKPKKFRKVVVLTYTPSRRVSSLFPPFPGQTLHTLIFPLKVHSLWRESGSAMPGLCPFARG